MHTQLLKIKRDERKKGRFVVNVECAALIDCNILQLCLNTVNECDDKRVWTAMFELKTDGEKE